MIPVPPLNRAPIVALPIILHGSSRSGFSSKMSRPQRSTGWYLRSLRTGASVMHVPCVLVMVTRDIYVYIYVYVDTPDHASLMINNKESAMNPKRLQY